MNRPKPPTIQLDAASVDAWRVERQLLAAGRAANDAAHVARHLVGVQAQVVSAAALAIALRSKADPDAPNLIDATTVALRERRLVRSWAMRGTLHLFAAQDVATVAAALGGKDNWRRPAWLRWFGVSEAEMDRLIDTIGDVLDDGRPRTRAELADEIGTRLDAKAGKLLLGSWGSTLKVASDRHYLVQAASEGAGVRFVKASRWIDAWREEDPQTALAGLVVRYLAAYGPATLKEILRWWGASVVAVMKPLVADLGDALTQVDVDGTRAYVRTEDVDDLRTTKATSGDVHLLGPFDPLIVGGGLRDALIPPAQLKRVSRTAGWISPVVLVDGRAAGVWDGTRTSKGIAITVDPFEPFDRARRAAVARAAERVAAAQGLTGTVRYGRVFDPAARGAKLVVTRDNA